ncbi:DUF1896 domain-containing protein [Proteiniphilum propionicum]|uniref:DUF1896 domain-containing protein n=1 Tax=Proteiniphilum propionicum TaxID=2829812 RepID=UPI001EEC0D30|nr:DUF1896 domain-containing protein [Proteiniphilum propionicum]ULB35749.1 DUF1896 domain-containing protein [Proteiniphilum propionicum]
MKQVQSQGLSYYRLSLLSFLKESHPQLLSDRDFIVARSDSAAEAYSEAVKSGFSHIHAEETANNMLYEGLHFSLLDTLITILWNEFSVEIPESRAREFALLLLPRCHDLSEKCTLSDDFLSSPEFDLLYTELTGFISIYIEEHGLQ